jgi:hypothetical protein
MFGLCGAVEGNIDDRDRASGPQLYEHVNKQHIDNDYDELGLARTRAKAIELT